MTGRVSHRLFFALWPDDSVRRGLQRLATGLPGHCGRLVHPLDRHVTLAFLGEVEAERLPCVEGAAATLSGLRFELLLDRIGYWPRPRILWAGASEVPVALQDLVQDLQQALRSCGFHPERRSYAPHVTLARKAVKVAGYELTEPVRWPARELVLVGSRLERPPPRYEVLARWPLG